MKWCKSSYFFFLFLLVLTCLPGCATNLFNWPNHGPSPLTIEYVKENPDLKKTDIHGSTLLHRAVLDGQLGVVKYLVEQGADVHARNAECLTPYHLAVEKNKKALADYLESKSKVKPNCSNLYTKKTSKVVIFRPFRLLGAPAPLYVTRGCSSTYHVLKTKQYVSIDLKPGTYDFWYGDAITYQNWLTLIDKPYGAYFKGHVQVTLEPGETKYVQLEKGDNFFYPQVLAADEGAQETASFKKGSTIAVKQFIGLVSVLFSDENGLSTMFKGSDGQLITDYGTFKRVNNKWYPEGCPVYEPSMEQWNIIQHLILTMNKLKNEGKYEDMLLLFEEGKARNFIRMLLETRCEHFTQQFVLNSKNLKDLKKLFLAGKVPLCFEKKDNNWKLIIKP